MFSLYLSLFIDINNFMQVTKYCNNIDEAKAAIKHSSLVGVCDPTGCIPRGLVFLTGLDKQHPSQTFITRVSCSIFVLLILHIEFVFHDV